MIAKAAEKIVRIAGIHCECAHTHLYTRQERLHRHVYDTVSTEDTPLMCVHIPSM